MNVLSQDDAFGNAVYNYTGCSTLHTGTGLRDYDSINCKYKKRETKGSPELLVDLRKNKSLF